MLSFADPDLQNCKDFVITGRKINQLNFPLTLRSKSGGMLITIKAHSRDNLLKSMQLIFAEFKQFGLICHVRLNNYKSKRADMYFPAPDS